MPQKDLRICGTVGTFDKMRHAPMRNQMEASTTAVTAARRNVLSRKVLLSCGTLLFTLIRPRYSPTQELYSLKLFPYHFEIDGSVKIIAGV